MCFPFDARPPALPPERVIAGGAGAEELTLTSGDGTEFSAALAHAPEVRGPGVVIFPDVRGLYPFYSELAERFAEAGHPAIALDPFGRTAGLGPRDDDFEFMPHVQQTRVETVQADAAAALAALRERTGIDAAVIVGFCFGGRQAFLANASPELALAGVVGFYGSLGERPGLPRPIERVREMRAPVLGLFGGADEGIPVDQVEEFDRALAGAGIEHELTVYPGAPHSFFDRKCEEYADACTDAWHKTLDFLARVT